MLSLRAINIQGIFNSDYSFDTLFLVTYCIRRPQTDNYDYCPCLIGIRNVSKLMLLVLTFNNALTCLETIFKENMKIYRCYTTVQIAYKLFWGRSREVKKVFGSISLNKIWVGLFH